MGITSWDFGVSFHSIYNLGCDLIVEWGVAKWFKLSGFFVLLGAVGFGRNRVNDGAGTSAGGGDPNYKVMTPICHIMITDLTM